MGGRAGSMSAQNGYLDLNFHTILGHEKVFSNDQEKICLAPIENKCSSLIESRTIQSLDQYSFWNNEEAEFRASMRVGWWLKFDDGESSSWRLWIATSGNHRPEGKMPSHATTFVLGYILCPFEPPGDCALWYSADRYRLHRPKGQWFGFDDGDASTLAKRSLEYRRQIPTYDWFACLWSPDIG